MTKNICHSVKRLPVRFILNKLRDNLEFQETGTLLLERLFASVGKGNVFTLDKGLSSEFVFADIL